MSCTVSGGVGRRARASRPRVARGFSLIELLVVIAIIALIISIVLPALGGVRTQARIVASQALSKTIKDAADAFAREHDRMPGYYSAEEMGHPENIARGMSAMENAMLDLMGGVVVVDGTTVVSSPSQVEDWGPTNALQSANQAANRVVDTARIGVQSENNPTYLTVDPKYLVEQEEGQQWGVEGHVKLDPNEPSIPDIVDAFNNPLLLWVENRNALTPIEEVDDFVAIDSGTNGDTIARFYWASNAAFLKADQLGSERRNQVPQAGGDRDYSIISDPNASGMSASGVRDRLAAVLGSPAYPREEVFGTPPVSASSDEFAPMQGRGSFVIQSAGPDGYYLNFRDRGNRRVGNDLRYSLNFYTSTTGTTRHQTDAGQPETVDVMRYFDDLFSTGGS